MLIYQIKISIWFKSIHLHAQDKCGLNLMMLSIIALDLTHIFVYKNHRYKYTDKMEHLFKKYYIYQ
jgi:hypothetical protein